MKNMMKTVSDEQLIEWIAEGDESMMGTLFERHHLQLFNFACRMTRQPALAEDIVQDTFMRMLKSAGRFRGDGSVKAWMYNIARNLIFDSHRQQQRQQSSDPAVFDELAADTGTPDGQTELDEQQALLERGMACLSQTALEALLLGKFHFNSFEELGAVLGCTAGNARVKVHRAAQQLKEHMMSLSQEPLR